MNAKLDRHKKRQTKWFVSQTWLVRSTACLRCKFGSLWNDLRARSSYCGRSTRIRRKLIHSGSRFFTISGRLRTKHSDHFISLLCLCRRSFFSSSLARVRSLMIVRLVRLFLSSLLITLGFVFVVRFVLDFERFETQEYPNRRFINGCISAHFSNLMCFLILTAKSEEAEQTSTLSEQARYSPNEKENKKKDEIRKPMIWRTRSSDLWRNANVHQKTIYMRFCVWLLISLFACWKDFHERLSIVNQPTAG